MEKKDRLNLNPEAEENNAQEENTTSETDVINVEQPNLPEENQDILVNNVSEEEVNEVEAKEPDSIIEPEILSDEPEVVAAPDVTETPEIIEVEAAAEVPESEEVVEKEVVPEPEVVIEPETEVENTEVVEAKEVTETPEVAVLTTPEVPAVDTNMHELIHQELISMDIATAVEEEEEEEEVEDDSLVNYATFSREHLVELLEKAVTESNITLIKRKVSNIRIEFEKTNKAFKEEAFKKYISESGEAEAYAPAEDVLEMRFRMAFDKFKQTKARFNEEQEKIKVTNLALKNEILDNLRTLIDHEEPLKKINDDFKALQDKWKTIGMVPKNEVTSLWNNYHFLVEKFHEIGRATCRERV